MSANRIKEAKDAVLYEAKRDVADKYNFESWDEGEMVNYVNFPSWIEEAMLLYHSMKIEESGRELPDEGVIEREINKIKDATGLSHYLGQIVGFRLGANFMRSKASLIISSLTSKLEEANKEIERLKGIIELKDL